MTGLIIIAVGVVLVALGAMITRAKVKGTFGDINEGTKYLSQGTGVVPAWVSLMVLLGWLAIAVGVVWAIVEMA